MKNKTYFKISIIYFIAITLIATLFALGYWGIIDNEYLSAFLIQIIVMFAVPMLAYTLLVSKNFKKTFGDCGFKKISVKTFWITILIGLVLYFLNCYVADIFAAITSLFGYEKITNPTIVKLDYAFLLKELVLSCILPGFCEEFLHRGIMLFAGKKTRNPRYCLLISSLLFGLMHLNINQFFYAAILGCLIGYVGFVADSIFPCMIIHFMNNFLGNYIYYGAKLKWTLPTLINDITTFIYSHPIRLLLIMFTSIPLLLFLYKKLVDKLQKEKAKTSLKSIVKELGMTNISVAEAQEKINMVNKLIHQKQINTLLQYKANEKPKFYERIFIISSIILGLLITISSFIWGII